MSACSSGGVLVRIDVRLLQRAADVDARFDALNQPARADVEERIHVVQRLAVEPDGAVAQDLEAAALEVVVAADGVDRADQRDRLARLLGRAQVAAEREVDARRG